MPKKTFKQQPQLKNTQSKQFQPTRYQVKKIIRHSNQEVMQLKRQALNEKLQRDCIYTFKTGETSQSANLLISVILLTSLTAAAARTIGIEPDIRPEPMSSGPSASDKSVLKTQSFPPAKVETRTNGDHELTDRTQELRDAGVIQGNGNIKIFAETIRDERPKSKSKKTKRKSHTVDNIPKPKTIPTIDRLVQAAQRGDVASLKKLIEQEKVDINLRDAEGRSAFLYAVSGNQLDVVRYLLTQPEINTELTDYSGYNAMHYAVEGPKSSLAMVQLLVDETFVKVKAPTNKGVTPLMLTKKPEIAKYLEETIRLKNLAERLFNAIMNQDFNTIKKYIEEENGDVEINLSYNYKKGNLKLTHIAIGNRQAKILKYLIEEAHADLDATDWRGHTALHFAAGNDEPEIVRYLLENTSIDITARNSDGETALDLAKRLNTNKEVISILTKAVEQLEKSHASKYSLKEHLEKIELIRDLVAKAKLGNYARKDIKKNAEKNNVLFSAARYDSSVDLVKYFVDEIELRTQHFVDGVLPIHVAAISGSLENVKYLMQKPGADLSDNSGGTLLGIAVRRGHIHIVKYLVEDAHVNVDQLSGKAEYTPLVLAVDQGNLPLVKYLVEVAKANVDVQSKNHGQSTALLMAIHHDNIAIARYLVEKAGVKISDFGTAMLYAVESKSKRCLQYLIDREYKLRMTNQNIRQEKPEIPKENYVKLAPLPQQTEKPPFYETFSFLFATASTAAAAGLAWIASRARRRKRLLRSSIRPPDKKINKETQNEKQIEHKRELHNGTRKTAGITYSVEHIKNETKDQVADNKLSSPHSVTLTSFDIWQSKFNDSDLFGCQVSTTESNDVKTTELRLLLKTEFSTPQKNKEALLWIAEEIYKHVSKKKPCQLTDFRVEESQIIFANYEHYKYIKIESLNYLYNQIITNPTITQGAVARAARITQATLSESKLTPLLAQSEPTATLSSKQETKIVASTEPPAKARTADIQTTLTDFPESKTAQKQTKHKELEVIVPARNEFKPAEAGVAHKMLAEKSKITATELLGAGAAKALDEAFMHQAYVKYNYHFLEGDFKASGTDFDRSAVELIKHFCLSYHLTRFFTMLDGCMPDQRQAAEEMRNATAHHMIDISENRQLISDCAQDIANKKLDPRCLLGFHLPQREKLKALILNDENKEEPLLITQSKLYRYLYPLAEKRIHNNIAKHIATQKINMFIRYINAATEQLVKEYKDKTGAWLTNTLSQKAQNNIELKYAARLDATKFLLTLIGEIVRHVLPQWKVKLWMKLKNQTETEKTKNLKKFTDQELFFCKSIDFRNKVLHGNEITTDDVLYLVYLGRTHVHNHHDLSATVFADKTQTDVRSTSASGFFSAGAAGEVDNDPAYSLEGPVPRT